MHHFLLMFVSKIKWEVIMEYYDMNMQKILPGDVLKFDNGNEYLVYYYDNHFVIQSIKKYSLSFNLNQLAPTGRVSAAEKMFNIFNIS